MDQATHNKIVSFTWGIADDGLRELFQRRKQILATVSQELATQFGVVFNYTALVLMAQRREVWLARGEKVTKAQVNPKARSAMGQGADSRGAFSATTDDGTASGEVVGLIRAARDRAAQAVNTAVVDLYWHSASTCITRSSLMAGPGRFQPAKTLNRVERHATPGRTALPGRLPVSSFWRCPTSIPRPTCT